MDKKSFQNYRKEALARIVSDYVGSGYYNKEEAARMAEELFEEMLPQGAGTPGQFLYNISEKNEKVGMLWYGIESKDYGYVNDFFVEEKYRDKGYEKEALNLLEEDARKKGVKSLDVSAYVNTSKLALFESVGYRPYYLRLSKRIS